MATGQLKLHSWAERNSEIEFLTVNGTEIIPVEVKSGIRTQAKSISVFCHKYAPQKAIILSAVNMQLDPNKSIQKYPLYLSGALQE